MCSHLTTRYSIVGPSAPGAISAQHGFELVEEPDRDEHRQVLENGSVRVRPVLGKLEGDDERVPEDHSDLCEPQPAPASQREDGESDEQIHDGCTVEQDGRKRVSYTHACE